MDEVPFRLAERADIIPPTSIRELYEKYYKRFGDRAFFIVDTDGNFFDDWRFGRRYSVVRAKRNAMNKAFSTTGLMYDGESDKVFEVLHDI